MADIKFELDGLNYTTDPETVKVLRSIAPAARRSGDPSAVAAIMVLGLQTGRIQPASEQARARIALDS